MNKEQLIKWLLKKTIRFTADGHTVVISQFEADNPVVRVDGDIVDSECLWEFNEFYIPSSMETPYGRVSYHHGGLYVFGSSPTGVGE